MTPKKNQPNSTDTKNTDSWGSSSTTNATTDDSWGSDSWGSQSTTTPTKPKQSNSDWGGAWGADTSNNTSTSAITTIIEEPKQVGQPPVPGSGIIFGFRIPTTANTTAAATTTTTAKPVEVPKEKKPVKDVPKTIISIDKLPANIATIEERRVKFKKEISDLVVNRVSKYFAQGKIKTKVKKYKKM